MKTKESEYVSGSVTVDEFQDENEIPISQSIDRFSVQAALVLLVYLATYLVSLGLTSFLAQVAPGMSKTLSALIWGFNFIIGSLLAIACRAGLGALRKAKLMTRQYPNNYLLSRVSGLSFDFMIVAGIASIEFKELKGLWIPFLLISILVE